MSGGVPGSGAEIGPGPGRNQRSVISRVLRDLRLGGLGRYGFDHSYLLYNVAESTVPAPLRGTGVRVGLVICSFVIHGSCVSNHVLSIVLRSYNGLLAQQEEELRRVMLNLYVKPGSPIAASPDARTYRREGRLDGPSICTSISARRTLRRASRSVDLHHHNPYLYLCGLIQ